MESPVLGLVLDSSAVIAAERKRQSVTALIETILAAYGPIELSLSPVTVGFWDGFGDGQVNPHQRLSHLNTAIHTDPGSVFAVMSSWQTRASPRILVTFLHFF